jgi:transcriptional regulator with XRE-family HTH domain
MPSGPTSKRHSSPAEIFGRNLRSERLKAGLTQVQLAELTGIPQSRLSALEGGNRDIMVSTAFKLARAIGCSFSDLFVEW